MVNTAATTAIGNNAVIDETTAFNLIARSDDPPHNDSIEAKEVETAT